MPTTRSSQLRLRDEARSLLAANRKCRQEAEASGDPALTKALDHLNELLSELPISRAD